MVPTMLRASNVHSANSIRIYFTKCIYFLDGRDSSNGNTTFSLRHKSYTPMLILHWNCWTQIKECVIQLGACRIKKNLNRDRTNGKCNLIRIVVIFCCKIVVWPLANLHAMWSSKVRRSATNCYFLVQGPIYIKYGVGTGFYILDKLCFQYS